MKKFFLSGGCLLFLLQTGLAQSASVDKIKLMEYFQNQQYEESIQYLQPVLANHSFNTQILGYLGYANYMNDNFADAEKYYKKVIATDSNNVSANQYLAAINNNSDPDAAQVYTRRLMALQPNKAIHYRTMGALLKTTKQKDSALTYYNHAYQISPADFRNATALAEILIEKKNFATADSILEAALQKDSLNITCLRLRIRSAHEAKDYQNAILPGERLMRLGDVSLNALTQLALSYYNLKLYSNTVTVCDYMLQNQMEIESVYYYEARACAKLKEYAKSNDLLQTCLAKAISTNAEMYYYNLGQNYEAINQFNLAVKQYDTAFYLFKDPLMKYYCGQIYETNLKNEKQARKYYMQYLQLAKPESPEEKKAYQYVKSKWGKKKTRL